MTKTALLTLVTSRYIGIVLEYIDVALVRVGTAVVDVALAGVPARHSGFYFGKCVRLGLLNKIQNVLDNVLQNLNLTVKPAPRTPLTMKK